MAGLLVHILVALSLAVSLPRQVRINGDQWQLITEPHILVETDCNLIVGLTSCVDRTIRLDSDLPKEEFIAIVIHELQHAMSGCAGNNLAVKVGCSPTARPLDTNLHQHIYDMAPRWRRLLHDNPQLVKFLSQ